MVKAMDGVPGSTEVATNLAASQPVVQVKVDRAKAVAAGLNEEQVAGLPCLHHQPRPGRHRPDRHQRLPGADRRGHPLHQHRRRPGHSRCPRPRGAGHAGAASPPWSRLTSRCPSPQQRAADRKGVRDAVGLQSGRVSAEVQDRLAGVELPAGVTADIGGATTQQAESFRQLGLALLAAIAIVYVIMVAAFKSLIQPLILLVSVPFAATGAVALLLVTGVPLGLPSLIGMLMLVGIVVTNAIVLIDLINQYRKPHDGSPGMNVADAITHGARQRLRPILMTALATVFALTPMALGLTGGGGFISQPLGDCGDRRAGLVHRADAGPGSGALQACGGPPGEEGSAEGASGQACGFSGRWTWRQRQFRIGRIPRLDHWHDSPVTGRRAAHNPAE